MWKSELKKMRVRTIVSMIILLVLLIMVIASKDWAIREMSTISQQLSEERMPKFLRKMIGSDMKGFLQRLKEDDFYIWSQWFGKNFGQFVPLVALIIAFPLFSREYERKTIYYLVARVQRSRIYFHKYMAGFSMLCATLLIFSLLPLLITLLMGWKVEAWKFSGYTLQSLVGGVTFYSIFILFSVLFKDQVKPILLGIAVIIGVAFLSISSKLNFLNLYSYIMSQNVFQNGKIDFIRTITYSCASIVFLFLGYSVFQRKEL